MKKITVVTALAALASAIPLRALAAGSDTTPTSGGMPAYGWIIIVIVASVGVRLIIWAATRKKREAEKEARQAEKVKEE